MQLRALGERIVIDTRVLSGARRGELAELWERCSDASGETDHDARAQPAADITLVSGGAASAHSAPRPRSVDVSVDVAVWEGAPYRLSRAVTRVALGKATGRDLLFHAAAIALQDGSVLVLVGPSGSGKTTAAMALGRLYGYVSDESVAIRSDGSVAAYPKPLSLVDASGACRKMEVSPSDAGLLQAPRTLRLGRVVLLARDPLHTGRPEIEHLDILDAATTAAEHTSGLVSLDRPLQRLAESLVTLGLPARLRYREISDCVDLVPTLMEHRATGQIPTWMHHPAQPLDPTAALRGGSAAAGTPPAWTRGSYVDAIESAGRVVVLGSGNVTLLDGIGASTWLAASDPSTMEEFVAAANDIHGPHREAQPKVADAVSQMERAGLLVRLR